LGALLGVLIAWIAASPFLLMQKEGVSAIDYGWLQVPIFAAYAVATRLVSPLYDRIGGGRLLKIGVLIILSAALLLVACPERFILAMMTYSFGFGLVAALLNRRVFTATDEKKGAVTAMFYVIEMVVACLVTLALSALAFSSIMIALSLAAGLTLLCKGHLRDCHGHKAQHSPADRQL
jgi:DHA1 family multidrug/chloramphenicol efflux transport protein-like MFS transporter